LLNTLPQISIFPSTLSLVARWLFRRITLFEHDKALTLFTVR
jgi:hypothetical protein